MAFVVLKKWWTRAYAALVPVRLESAAAQQLSDSSLLNVVYTTNRPIEATRRSSLATYLIDQADGRRLLVQQVPYIGALSSRLTDGAGGTTDHGYFIVDNSEGRVGPGSRVTVVVGDLRFADVEVHAADDGGAVVPGAPGQDA